MSFLSIDNKNACTFTSHSLGFSFLKPSYNTVRKPKLGNLAILNEQDTSCVWIDVLSQDSNWQPASSPTHMCEGSYRWSRSPDIILPPAFESCQLRLQTLWNRNQAQCCHLTKFTNHRSYEYNKIIVPQHYI